MLPCCWKERSCRPEELKSLSRECSWHDALHMAEDPEQGQPALQFCQPLLNSPVLPERLSVASCRARVLYRGGGPAALEVHLRYCLRTWLFVQHCRDLRWFCRAQGLRGPDPLATFGPRVPPICLPMGVVCWGSSALIVTDVQTGACKLQNAPRPLTVLCSAIRSVLSSLV